MAASAKAFLRFHAPLALLLTLGPVACGSDAKPPSHVGEEEPRVPEVTMDVDWNETTYLVGPSSADAAAYEVEDETTVLLREGSAEELAAMSHIMLDGLGLFEILGVSAAEEGVRLLLQPGSLLDAAERGELSWSIPGDLNGDVLELDTPEKAEEKRADSDERTAIAQRSEALLDASGRFSGSVRGVSVSASFSPKDGGIGADLTLSAGPTSPTTATWSSTAKGVFRYATQSGHYAFEDGKVTDFRMGLEQAEADFDLEVRATGLKDRVKIAVPYRIALPFSLGGIPAFIMFGFDFDVEGALDVEDSGSASSHVHWSGSTGIELRDGALVNTTPAASASAESTGSEFRSVFSVGLSTVVTFPRIDLGVGVLKGNQGTKKLSTGGSLFISFRSERLSNFRVEANLFTGDKRWCLEDTASWQLLGGSSLKLLGLGFDTTFPLGFDTSVERKGEACR